MRQKIILASRSPRRKKALKQIVAKFRTMAVSEPKRARGRSLVAKTRYLALAKAKAAAKHYPDAIIVAADTLACCRGKIMGKAKGIEDARSMLKRLSEHRFDVVTSIAVKRPDAVAPIVWSEYGWTKFGKLEKGEIEKYLRSGRWKGKAAAINVEEKPIVGWIIKKGGEQGAVIGLPRKRLRKELAKIGVAE